MSKEYRVAVVGATGAVGRAMRSILAERDFPVKQLVALATAKSAGTKLDYCGEEVTCRELTADSFKDIDLALFSAGGGTSLTFAPAARDAGCVVIDNSSAWRMDPDVPLVVPEVNPDDVEWHKGMIANPNCSTIQMVVMMKPLHDAVPIRRVVVSTYQAVSGTGAKAINELVQQTGRLLAGEAPEVAVYPHQIAFNCLPHIDVFLEDGYTKEERKMVDETKKIMGDDSIAVSATCVRVPVQNGHSESVNLEFAAPMTVERARELLMAAPGVQLVDDVANKVYPMPIVASGKDDTMVGRIRRDPTIANGLNLWVVADNLRKGAALNAVQIAELLTERDLVRVPRWGDVEDTRRSPGSDSHAVSANGPEPSATESRKGRSRWRRGKTWLIVGAVVLAVLVMFAAYSYSETYRVQVKEYAYSSPGVPAAFDGARIVLLTDIHRSFYYSQGRLAGLVDRVNALTPDMVVLGGDYVYGNKDREASAFAELQRLKAPLGTFAVLGNHDYAHPGHGVNDPGPTVNAIAAARIPLLDNAGAWVERAGQRLRVAGVSDLQQGKPDATAAIGDATPDDLVILASHQPDLAEKLQPAAAGLIDLMLSGHTHGGQVTFFGLWAPVVASEYGQKYRTGVAVKGGTTVVVSNGVGAIFPPLRFFAPPQIVVITLKKTE